VLSKAPKATGWKKDLYATDEIEGLDRYFIEREVLRPIDNDAARSLRYLKTYSHGPTDARLNSAWTRFLLTLLYRSPAQIDDLRRSIPEHAPTIFSDVKEQFPHIPDEKIHQILAAKNTHEGAYQNLLRGLFTEGEVARSIRNMLWCVIKLGKTRFDLLTSDQPLILSNGLGWSNSFLILPIGPQNLFVACHDKRIGDHILEMPAKELVETINDIVVRQAEEFVIARDEKQHRFIENRFMVSSVAPRRDPRNQTRWEFSGLFRMEEIRRIVL
jgi:hypothetical protein